MLEIFQYSFILRGFTAGIIISILAPLVGIFLVLRRYSLIADTLAHVSLAGVAIGLLTKTNPLLTAIVASMSGSLLIEKLRGSKRVLGESALALFLAGSLAVAVVLIGVAHGFSVDLFSYLFGSIFTVRIFDIKIISGIGIIAAATLIAFYKELVFMSFDEEAARVSGIPNKFLNTLFILIASMLVAAAIPIVGVLLVSALIVVPVVTALQFKKSFWNTLLLAELFSIASVISGIFVSFYLDLPPGGVIVLLSLLLFIFSLITNKK